MSNVSESSGPLGNLRLGEFELSWLAGGSFELDGGTAFGPVPKVLWEKKISCCEGNYVPIAAFPILLRTPQALIMVETGAGNKLTPKQAQILRTRKAWHVLENLKKLGIRREEIDYVILTHYDWDHSAGVVYANDGGLELTFPNAKHFVQKKEWEDVLKPNKRAAHTYWPINWETLERSDNLELVDGETEIVPGISVALTGGHTRGHQILEIASRGEQAVYLGDLLPTHAHVNPLWVTAYDNFPLDSISMKEKYIPRYVDAGAWFLFYQDPVYLACKFDAKGEVMEGIKA